MNEWNTLMLVMVMHNDDEQWQDDAYR